MSLLHLAQKILGASIPVLCYHQVRPQSGMTPRKFATHLDLLQSLGFQTISLATLYQIVTGQKELTHPAVVITFDDCTVDNWIYALPELLQRNMRGVFFAITDFLLPGQLRPRADQTNTPLSVPDFPTIMRRALNRDCLGFMNHAEIRALVHDLGQEVYVHSAAHQACFTSTTPCGALVENKHWSHRALLGPDAAGHSPVYPVGSAYAHNGFGLDWRGQPLELQSKEQRLAFCLEDFSQARARLESILGQPCPFLCLPWGQYDTTTLNAASQAGYKAVLTLDRAQAQHGKGLTRLGRLAIKDKKSRLWLAIKALCLALKPLARLAGTSRQA